MTDHWRYVRSVTVRNCHTSFIAEARNGAQWVVGEFSDSPTAAMESAVEKFFNEIVNAAPPPKKPARKKAEPPPPPPAETEDWEDLL